MEKLEGLTAGHLKSIFELTDFVQEKKPGGSDRESGLDANRQRKKQKKAREALLKVKEQLQDQQAQEERQAREEKRAQEDLMRELDNDIARILEEEANEENRSLQPRSLEGLSLYASELLRLRIDSSLTRWKVCHFTLPSYCVCELIAASVAGRFVTLRFRVIVSANLLQPRSLEGLSLYASELLCLRIDSSLGRWKVCHFTLPSYYVCEFTANE